MVHTTAHSLITYHLNQDNPNGTAGLDIIEVLQLLYPCDQHMVLTAFAHKFVRPVHRLNSNVCCRSIASMREDKLAIMLK